VPRTSVGTVRQFSSTSPTRGCARCTVSALTTLRLHFCPNVTFAIRAGAAHRPPQSHGLWMISSRPSLSIFGILQGLSSPPSACLVQVVQVVHRQCGPSRLSLLHAKGSIQHLSSEIPQLIKPELGCKPSHFHETSTKGSKFVRSGACPTPSRPSPSPPSRASKTPHPCARIHTLPSAGWRFFVCPIGSRCRHSSHRHPPLPNQPTPQTRRTTRSSVVAKAQNAVTGRTVSQSGIFPPSDAPRAVFPRWQDSVFERWDDCPSHSRALSQSRSSPLPRGAARNIPSLGIS